MKNKRTTLEEAITIYNEYFRKSPTTNEITDIWHNYANNWKLYDGFKDFLVYHAS